MDVNASVADRKVLAEKNAQLEDMVAQLTKKLNEVELSKAETEKKAKKMEAEVKTLKKTKGFTPSLEGLQVPKVEGDVKPASKKDDTKPKHPTSAYLLYSNAHREQARAANPELSFGDLTKVLSDMWKNASTEDKSTFEAQAATDRARYQAEMVKYNKEQEKKKAEEKALELLHERQEQELAMTLLKQYQEFVKETAEEAKGGKAEADPNKPKRNLSAFMFFSTETRKAKMEKGVDASFTELSKLIGEEWGKLSAAKKKKYEKMAEADAERYRAEMEVYNSGKAAEAAAAAAAEAERASAERTQAQALVKEMRNETEAKKLLKEHKKAEEAERKAVREEKKAKKAAKAGMPKRPATAYLLWCNANRENMQARHPGAGFTDMTKLLAEAWKGIDQEERAVFQGRAEVEAARYQQEMAAYRAEHPDATSSLMESGSCSGSVMGDDEVSSAMP